MPLLKYLLPFFLVLGFQQASSATSLAAQAEEVEVTIFYSADICGYLEPCG